MTMMNIYTYLASVFKSVLVLPYGDKVAHFIVGNTVLVFVFLDVPLSGLSTLALFLGLSIELTQRLALLKKFNLYDVIATWLGGTFGAFWLFYFDFITLVY